MGINDIYIFIGYTLSEILVKKKCKLLTQIIHGTGVPLYSKYIPLGISPCTSEIQLAVHNKCKYN